MIQNIPIRTFQVFPGTTGKEKFSTGMTESVGGT